MSRRLGFRTIVSSCVMVLCAGLLGLAQPVAAQDAVPHFTISGTSTVRAWSCPAQGTIKVTPGKSAAAVPGFPGGVQTVAVTVQVREIACEDSTMNDHLRDALKEKMFPAITYQLDQYTLAGNEGVKATGKLTIAGITRPVSFDLRRSESGQGVRVVGETSVDMTQFKIVPPDLWAGMLKVGKDVRIRFDAVLQP